MAKSNWAIAIGAAAAALSMAPLSAGAATASPQLMQPIPNATPGDAKAIQTQWYYHRHRYWRRGYYYGRPYWWRRHHHDYRHYRRWY
jgi:hypothetical protein